MPEFSWEEFGVPYRMIYHLLKRRLKKCSAKVIKNTILLTTEVAVTDEPKEDKGGTGMGGGMPPGGMGGMDY